MSEGIRNNPMGDEGMVEVDPNPRTDQPPLGKVFKSEQPDDATRLGRKGPVKTQAEQKKQPDPHERQQ